MKKIIRKKMLLDGAILVTSWLWVVAAWYYQLPKWVLGAGGITAVMIAGMVMIDLQKLSGQSEDNLALLEQAAARFASYELVLLNEHDKPIRAWDLTGKTAMVIGRKGKNEEVHVDLSDCEYSALINVQHAVLNFSLDSWYIEDLGSQNGIRIKKAEDGVCYQVTANRPCKISAGDVIYIAKTKLLFT